MGERRFKKYDHSAVISRQVDNINSKVSGGVGPEEGFDNYFNSVVMSMMCLDGMLEPFKDEEYENPFDEVTFTGMNRQKQLKFVKEAMREMTMLMYRKNLFYSSSTTKTVGGKD